MLLLRLRQVQEEAEDAGDEAALLEYGVNRVAGLRQQELITWYFDLLADRWAMRLPSPFSTQKQFLVLRRAGRQVHLLVGQVMLRNSQLHATVHSGVLMQTHQDLRSNAIRSVGSTLAQLWR